VTSLSSWGDARVRHPSANGSIESRFAHPSERLFASLLTVYGIEWHYEPLEFPLAWDVAGRAVRGFRPDFYLPSMSLFIELTVLEQRLVTKKNRKIREFRALYPEVTLLVVYQRDFLALLKQHDLGTLGDYAA
jgi:bifunctional protein TilS/HprT